VLIHVDADRSDTALTLKAFWKKSTPSSSSPRSSWSTAASRPIASTERAAHRRFARGSLALPVSRRSGPCDGAIGRAPRARRLV